MSERDPDPTIQDVPDDPGQPVDGPFDPADGGGPDVNSDPVEETDE